MCFIIAKMYASVGFIITRKVDKIQDTHMDTFL